ncbi:MAG: Tfp pilus assembly protein PilF, partial [Xenococcaceae cyanobacterium]
MPTITVSEKQKTDDGFEATLCFDGGVKYAIAITNPFTPQDEQRLEWYYEDWLVFPLLDATKAEEAAASVKVYGENLFEQVFGDRKVYSEYKKLRNNLSQLQIEIESQTPEFQGLHWEALRDPDLTRPLAV